MQLDQEMKACISNCTNCHELCVQTIAHCLAKGSKHADAEHLTLMQTCADICRVSADAMLRGDDAHSVICGACAELCERCAKACESFSGDTQMQACAKACRTCAESCSAMAEMA